MKALRPRWAQNFKTIACNEDTVREIATWDTKAAMSVNAMIVRLRESPSTPADFQDPEALSERDAGFDCGEHNDPAYVAHQERLKGYFKDRKRVYFGRTPHKVCSIHQMDLGLASWTSPPPTSPDRPLTPIKNDLEACETRQHIIESLKGANARLIIARPSAKPAVTQLDFKEQGWRP